MYIYIERESERERERSYIVPHTYIYEYLYIYMMKLISPQFLGESLGAECDDPRAPNFRIRMYVLLSLCSNL